MYYWWEYKLMQPNRPTIWPSNSTPGYIADKSKNRFWRSDVNLPLGCSISLLSISRSITKVSHALLRIIKSNCPRSFYTTWLVYISRNLGNTHKDWFWGCLTKKERKKYQNFICDWIHWQRYIYQKLCIQ